MQFRPDTLGVLVRPRILTGAVAYCEGSMNPDLLLKTLVEEKPPRLTLWELTPKPSREIFSTLSLGDTTEDLSRCYVGQVTHYLVKVGGQALLVDKGNVQEALKKIRKLLGVRTHLRILGVGLKFFTGMVKDENGKVQPINPWNPEWLYKEEGTDPIWFFRPWEVVPVEEIMKYESARPGDLIEFKRSAGLVIKKKKLNKPKFFCTSSWSCYSIILLNTTADGWTRFLPDRQFKVHSTTPLGGLDPGKKD